MTSVATLFRQAKQAKSPKIAAKLRKQAAEMRQSRRVKPRKVKKTNGHDDVQMVAGTEVTRIAGEMRRERERERLEHLDEVRRLREKHNDELRTMSEIAHINVLCAFIADMEGNQSLYGGALPSSVMVSGMTIARIIAQLREDGFSTEGRRGVDRKNIHKNLI